MNKELLKKLEQNQKELGELKQAFASLSEKFASETLKMKADMAKPDLSNEDVMNHMDRGMSYMHDMISNIHQRIDRHGDALYNHMTAGHLPPIKSPSQMEAALKKLGLENDYVVHKPYISVASNQTKKGLEITASFKSEKS